MIFWFAITIFVFIILIIILCFTLKSSQKKIREIGPPKPIIITNKQGLQFDTNYHGTLSDLWDENNQPGPTYWNPNNSFIGEDGELHLKLAKNAVQNPESWASAEAKLLTPCNYGYYWFTVQFKNGIEPYSSEFNTTFGAYTYRKLKKDVDSVQPGLSVCYPNRCNEIDMIEWGKGREQYNTAAAQWGIQPWYKCQAGFSDTQCTPTWELDSLNIIRLNLTPEQIQAIKDAGYNMTFKMLWESDNVELWGNPGDFGLEPWNSFPQYSMWYNKIEKSQKLFIPQLTPELGDTYLMFNLWIDATKTDAPINEREVIIKNILVPSEFNMQIINEICNLYHQMTDELSKNFLTLCNETINCFKCPVGRESFIVPWYWRTIDGCSKPMNKNNFMNMIYTIWINLDKIRDQYRKAFQYIYEHPVSGKIWKDIDVAPFDPPFDLNIIKTSKVHPDLDQYTYMNRNNILEVTYNTIKGIRQEYGKRFEDIFGKTMCGSDDTSRICKPFEATQARVLNTISNFFEGAKKLCGKSWDVSRDTDLRTTHCYEYCNNCAYEFCWHNNKYDRDCVRTWIEETQQPLTYSCNFCRGDKCDITQQIRELYDYSKEMFAKVDYIFGRFYNPQKSWEKGFMITHIQWEQIDNVPFPNISIEKNVDAEMYLNIINNYLDAKEKEIGARFDDFFTKTGCREL